MKKTVVILLMLIYGSATMGSTVHLHYCMDEFVGWSLNQNKDEKCGRCGMDETDMEGCCKDEQQHFKLKTDHQKTNVEQSISLFGTPVLSVPVIDFSFQSVLNSTESYSPCHAPPDIDRKRLHLLYGVFLI